MKQLFFLFFLFLSFGAFAQTTSTTLSATANDKDGTIASLLWSQTSGPSASTITTPNAATTTVTGLAVGVYVFTCTAKDNNGAVATAPKPTVKVTVLPVNIAPTIDAGPDQTIQIPGTAMVKHSTSSVAKK